MAARNKFTEEEIKASLIMPGEAGRITYDAIEAAQSGQDYGYKLGLARLDRALTGGLKPGDLMIVGARPGSGKSFLVNKILQYNSGKGIPCLFVSAEMTAIQLGVRGFSYTAEIDSKRLLEGNVSAEEWTRVADAAAERGTLPLYLVARTGIPEKSRINRPPITIELIHATIDYLAERDIQIKMVGIDYAQRLRSDYGQRQRKDIADEVSAGAKDIALRGTAVILASQLGRQVEDRIPPTPMESDFKESGNFEEDADVIITIFNPLKYYEVGQRIPRYVPPETVEANKALIQLWKQRLGASNMKWWIYFDPRFAKMADLETRLSDKGS